MAAFKAANPGACFEDLVRWLSPRDWIAGGPEGGSLSPRMAQKVCPQTCDVSYTLHYGLSVLPDAPFKSLGCQPCVHI